MAAFLKAKQGELSDAELDGVAGGCKNNDEVVLSTISLGTGCAILAIMSAVEGKTEGKVIC